MQTAEETKTEKSPDEIHICPLLGRTVLFREGECLSLADCPERRDCPFLPT